MTFNARSDYCPLLMEGWQYRGGLFWKRVAFVEIKCNPDYKSQ